jgi:hypothetical protein
MMNDEFRMMTWMKAAVTDGMTSLAKSKLVCIFQLFGPRAQPRGLFVFTMLNPYFVLSTSYFIQLKKPAGINQQAYILK